jgi:ribosomal protein L31E
MINTSIWYKGCEKRKKKLKLNLKYLLSELTANRFERNDRLIYLPLNCDI